MLHLRDGRALHSYIPLKEFLQSFKEFGFVSINRGIIVNKEEIYISVSEGDYGVERGAQKLGISEAEFLEKMRLPDTIVHENIFADGKRQERGDRVYV